MEGVIPAGFEPATRSLEGCCSIQLSYETIAGAKIESANPAGKVYFPIISFFEKVSCPERALTT